jgi:hypothetical protein
VAGSGLVAGVVDGDAVVGAGLKDRVDVATMKAENLLHPFPFQYAHKHFAAVYLGHAVVFLSAQDDRLIARVAVILTGGEGRPKRRRFKVRLDATAMNLLDILL